MNVRVTVWGRGGGKGGEYELGTVLLKHHFLIFLHFLESIDFKTLISAVHLCYFCMCVSFMKGE